MTAKSRHAHFLGKIEMGLIQVLLMPLNFLIREHQSMLTLMFCLSTGTYTAVHVHS